MCVDVYGREGGRLGRWRDVASLFQVDGRLRRFAGTFHEATERTPVDFVEILLDEPIESTPVDLVEILLDESIKPAPVDLVEIPFLAAERYAAVGQTCKRKQQQQQRR